MLLLLLSASAFAEDVVGCTAFGQATLTDGTSGPIHGPEWTVELLEGAAAIRMRDEVVWRGPAASLAFEAVKAPPAQAPTVAVSPRDSTALELSRIVEAQMWNAGVPPSCLWGGHFQPR